MSNQLAKKRTELVTGTLMMFLISIGLTASCTQGQTNQSENKAAQQINIKPKETPVPFQPTKQNNGKRCKAKNYVGVPKSEVYDPECYELQTKLTMAVEDGNLAEIREALRYGANPDGSVDDYHPPLIVAAEKGNSDVVRLLLDNAADVNHGTFIIGTPLVVAANGGHIEVVKLLLERGANVCFKADGGTAEEFAQKRGYKEIAELLKAAQATNCK